jgi:hypothetical protein
VSIQLIGFALVGFGFVALISAGPLGRVFGLLLVLNGVNLVRNPGTRHRGLEELLLKLLDRWRSPPAP